MILDDFLSGMYHELYRTVRCSSPTLKHCGSVFLTFAFLENHREVFRLSLRSTITLEFTPVLCVRGHNANQGSLVVFLSLRVGRLSTEAGCARETGRKRIMHCEISPRWWWWFSPMKKTATVVCKGQQIFPGIIAGAREITLLLQSRV